MLGVQVLAQGRLGVKAIGKAFPITDELYYQKMISSDICLAFHGTFVDVEKNEREMTVDTCVKMKNKVSLLKILRVKIMDIYVYFML